MAELKQITSYIDTLLQIDQFQDYCPNGLQVEGKCEVTSIVTGVTACQALIDAAIEARADAVLVHHGYFWKGEDPCITGMKKRRIGRLLEADVSLLAYHLSLDAHPELGNNAQLGEKLAIHATGSFGQGRGPDIGMTGELEQPVSAAEFVRHIQFVLGREPLHIAPGGTASDQIQRIAWCTGAAQGYIEAAIDLGVDAYLTGEVSEQTVHVAREAGIHFFAAGHHATERYGVQALGEHLAKQFQLKHQFIDIDNPV